MGANKYETTIQMKRHLPFALASILCLAGGCSTHCVDCIPHAKMPYVLYDKGSKYYLTDHLSIDQLMESETEKDSIEKRWPQMLREKLPDDKELLAYLDLRDKRLKESYEKAKKAHWDNLWDVKDNLEKSQGELYYYHLLGKRGLLDAKNRPAVEVEEGWLILSKGKVVKHYDAGNGIVSEGDLKDQGLK